MKILIATDGSEFSRQAIAQACDIVINAENSVISIISIPEEIAYSAAEPFAVSLDYIHEMEKLGHEQAVLFTNDAEAAIRARFPDSEMQITTKIVRGAAGRTIVEEAEKFRADLIVVGSHGYGFWNRMFLGSVSSSVVHHAPCPVLIVKIKEV